MLKRSDQRSGIRDLEQWAGIRRRTRQATPDDLKAMGLGVIQEPANG